MKMKRTLLAVAAITGLGIGLSSDLAATETVYGWQLMTPDEWAEHRTAMRSLPPAERVAYRDQHHEQMKQRAEAQGLTLPDEPVFAGGPGRGYGRGYGFRGAGPCRNR